MLDLNRPIITPEILEAAFQRAHDRISDKKKKKGSNAFASHHETYGKLGEEMHELICAIHAHKKPVQKQSDYDAVVEELADVAITAIWGIASLDAFRAE